MTLFMVVSPISLPPLVMFSENKLHLQSLKRSSILLRLTLLRLAWCHQGQVSRCLHFGPRRVSTDPPHLSLLIVTQIISARRDTAAVWVKNTESRSSKPFNSEGHICCSLRLSVATARSGGLRDVRRLFRGI